MTERGMVFVGVEDWEDEETYEVVWFAVVPRTGESVTWHGHLCTVVEVYHGHVSDPFERAATVNIVVQRAEELT